MHSIHCIALVFIFFTIEKYRVLWSATAIYLMGLIGSNYHHEMHFLFSRYFCTCKKRLKYKKEVIYLKYTQFV